MKYEIIPRDEDFFLFSTVRNFSDTEYNKLVDLLNRTTDINKTTTAGVSTADFIVIHFASKEDYNKYASDLQAMINSVLGIGGYNPNPAAVDNWGTSVSGTITNKPNLKYFHYETIPSGIKQANKDLRRKRADNWIANLKLIKTGGKITGYNPLNPNAGITANSGRTINVPTVLNNSAKPLEVSRVITDPNIDPDDPANLLSGNEKSGTKSLLTPTNLLIAGAVILGLFLLLRKKKPVTP